MLYIGFYGLTGFGRCNRMSFGKMNTKIEIVQTQIKTDKEGFKEERETTLHTIRAYREGRHGSERWANRATFSTATDLFRLRKIPNFEITTDMRVKVDGRRFEITSVEDVKGRGMYIELLCKEVKKSG